MGVILGRNCEQKRITVARGVGLGQGGGGRGTAGREQVDAEDEVVDETDVADGDGAGEDEGRTGGGEFGEIEGVGDAEVVETDGGFGGDEGGHDGAEGGGVGFAGGEGGAGGYKRTVEDRCGGAAGRVESPVATAEGEAVGGADGGDDVELDIEGKTVDEGVDDAGLLPVFLAEVGGVGTDLVEKAGDDGGDSVEMAGAGGALEDGGQGTGVEGGFEAVGVHDLDRRRPDEVDTVGGEDFKIAFAGAGILLEVAGDAELGGVDEEAGGDGVAAGPGGAQEGPVAVMQGAHGGDEAKVAGDGAAVATQGG